MMAGLTERTVGVGPVGPGLGALLRSVRATFDFAPGARPALDIGYFANVVPIGRDLGVAISTDGVGTKVLVAAAAGRFDTVGIDCVAMNVNDVLCVGARPLALVDYIAVAAASPDLLGPLGEGLARGCAEAGISCPGGELAQVRELLHPAGGELVFDIVGTAIGVVSLDAIVTGRDIEAGDVLLGLASSGLHSNGFTLARRVLLDRAGLRLGQRVPELGRVLADELLEPTRIYVRPVLALLEAGISVRALAHITGDGLFNLVRTEKAVGFEITDWPEPPRVFDLVQRLGEIEDGEMFRAFNMGIGFCVVVPAGAVDRAVAILGRAGAPARPLGHAVEDPERTIRFHPRRLVGLNGSFVPG